MNHYLSQLMAAIELETVGDKSPLHACVDKLSRNPVGYRALFDVMDPALQRALGRVCEEMRDGLQTMLEAIDLGQDAEGWERLGKNLTIDTSVREDLEHRVAALSHLYTLLTRE